MTRIAIAFCISISFLIGLPGCYTEPGPPEVREPRCEPRSTTDPIRLTLETSAEDYGAIPPCQPIVSFFLMGTSNLRSIEGSVEIIGPAGEVLHEEPIRAALEESSFRSDVHIDSVDGHICRALTLDLEVLHCSDGDGNPIECPEVRVKQSYVLESFTAHGADIEVCFDN